MELAFHNSLRSRYHVDYNASSRCVFDYPTTLHVGSSFEGASAGLSNVSWGGLMTTAPTRQLKDYLMQLSRNSPNYCMDANWASVALASSALRVLLTATLLKWLTYSYCLLSRLLLSFSEA